MSVFVSLIVYIPPLYIYMYICIIKYKHFHLYKLYFCFQLHFITQEIIVNFFLFYLITVRNYIFHYLSSVEKNDLDRQLMALISSYHFHRNFMKIKKQIRPMYSFIL